MISAIFIFLAGTVLNIFSWLLSGLGFIVPTQVSDAIRWVFSNVYLLSGVFPVDELLTAVSTLLTFFTFWYIFKLILFFVSFIPGIGHKNHPRISEDALDLSGRTNSLNLRGKHPKSRIDKRMRF